MHPVMKSDAGREGEGSHPFTGSTSCTFETCRGASVATIPRILLCSLEMFLDLLTTISNNANISQSYFKMQLKLFLQSLEVLSSIIERP
jgi:hypothetical protein